MTSERFVNSPEVERGRTTHLWVGRPSRSLGRRLRRLRPRRAPELSVRQAQKTIPNQESRARITQQTFRGSSSAVSKRVFALKYSCCSVFSRSTRFVHVCTGRRDFLGCFLGFFPFRILTSAPLWTERCKIGFGCSRERGPTSLIHNKDSRALIWDRCSSLLR